MIFRSLVAASVAAFSLIPAGALAKKSDPTVDRKQFDNPIENLFYFDDSNVILGHDREELTVYRSADAGATWEPIDDDGQAGEVWDLWPHPYDSQRAYLLSLSHKHWMTRDQGKTWIPFDSGSAPDPHRGTPLHFHGRDSKKVIFNGQESIGGGLLLDEVAYYTADDFKTVHRLGDDTRGCYWAVGTPQFAEPLAAEVDDRVFCVKQGLYSPFSKDFRLAVSDDYFRDQEIEPALDQGRAVTGVISMASVKKYLVAAAKSEGTNELALYVTDDSATWHRAVFGQHRVEEGAYTILESTNYSMQVDVLGSKPTNPMGFLFTSNSNGTYFTKNIEYTNRNLYGRVDFEKVSNIQGIVLVNVVDNAKEVEGSTVAEKQVVSQISFDDGRTFQDLRVADERLHLHSVTDAKQGGRVFSSPAPGIVMGVGNTGKTLKPYSEGDLFVSDDAGVTWTQALDGAHLYEFGNQGAVLVAIDDEEPTSYLRYSTNHGKTWEKADLGMSVRARFLTTVPDSTTLKFLLMGTHGTGSKTEWHVFKVDFDGLHERSCGERDFEKWPARVNDKGDASCLMGHKTFFRRRKADADCLVDGEFQDPEPIFEQCLCTEADFECDFNFVRSEDRKSCLPAAPLAVPEGECRKPDDTFLGTSGWRLIPGNECKRKGGVELDRDVERPCTDTVKRPVSGTVDTEKSYFSADRFMEWYYLERADKALGSDETVVMRTSEQDIYITRDHGKTWAKILDGKPITSIMPNPNFHDAVFFLTGSETVHYTIDRGDKFDSFTAPKPPSNIRLPHLKFHPDYKDWFLWSGAEGSDDHTNVYYTHDRGDHWETLVRYARKCDFIRREEKDQLIFCAQHEKENPDNNLMLVSSNDFFAKETVHFPDILDFATMSEFIIVAQKTEDKQSLQVDASVNGQTFAAAKFPKNFQVKHQQAYTVLDSSTHAVFLHVTVNPNAEHEYGTIIKSNSNGTSYVKVLDHINRDSDGYVDFEKMHGLEGVAMVNVVANADKVEGGEKKLLKSMISHNDGSDWVLMDPPDKDALGHAYRCVSGSGKATAECALHIHSFTERMDKSATFSSPTAVGLMLAVGNVGPNLVRKADESTDTFITRDAGLTWHSVKKGSYFWEFGDQGSIIVIVPEARATKSLFYTLDEGENWTEYEFSPEAEMEIFSITTVPSDTSRNFLLWGRETGPNSHRGIATVNLDFSNLKERSRQCELDEKTGNSKDYTLWEPRHPFQDENCLFGHVAQYHRKIPGADCYNGQRIDHLHNIARNCTCTRSDFECDYNYQRREDGTCALVEGYQPPDHEQICRDNPDKVEWYYPSGYRRIPLSTCEGGQELDKLEARPCPNHEDEFRKKHGGALGGVVTFFIVVSSVAAAGGIGYWVWQQYQTHGFGGFGQIRLGESLGNVSSPGRRGGVFGGQSPLIVVPVAIISGVVAVTKALPLLATSLFRSARGYVPVGGGGGGGGGRSGGGAPGAHAYSTGPYRTRDAFANRQQDYSSVEDDELLGEDDDAEEV